MLANFKTETQRASYSYGITFTPHQGQQTDCLIQVAASKATWHHSENVDIGKPTGNAVYVGGALQGMRGQGVTPRSPWCRFLGNQTTASTWYSGILSIFIQKEAVILEALNDSSSLCSPACWRETLPLPKHCLLAEARKHLCLHLMQCQPLVVIPRMDRGGALEQFW